MFSSTALSHSARTSSADISGSRKSQPSGLVIVYHTKHLRVALYRILQGGPLTLVFLAAVFPILRAGSASFHRLVIALSVSVILPRRVLPRPHPHPETPAE